MPKKGENSKAVEAKARKAEAAKQVKDKKEKAAEDASWEDNDRNLARKQNRKAEEEKKRLEKLQRKNESKALEEQEKESIVVSKTPAVQKVTQAQIEAERERREAAARKSAKNNASIPKVAPLVENLNRSTAVEEATTVDEALKMLTVSDDADGDGIDRHPERRVKAAYNAFEEARLSILKAENPSLRLTQLKQKIFEEWKKSPDNPMNKDKVAAYNSK
ncbi:coiled-coil domain-containing protein 124 [Folsomia candida]|uniref:Coiled-coil domain-containing protein n=1 Tax=Folsomia candida TaxID=158441 RepID=A0A226ER66_FOLCA|nr:coiled-coil domain-containing protein 124 [Folsomia candida]XP_021944703.1 coiled-coil domain-containing protein 124 [Folsomia candida]OXA59999.1 hypothetical protein Fcan01_06100 [Folsomia candida]